MIERLNQLVKEKKSFAFETTLSGIAYLPFIKQAKLAGYHIILFFIWLENFELAKSRVAERVKKRGHNIPGDIIERRYKKGLENFLRFASKVNDWYIFDNSGTEYFIIARSVKEVREIFNFEIFNKIIAHEFK